MIDILVYLFETYGYADACPAEPEQLARKLSAAGFEQGEISEAIEWLSGLRDMLSETAPIEENPHAFRIYTEEEQARLDLACRGFLSFLEGNGTLTPRQREFIVERTMALPESEVSLSKLKVIVLMVLWQEQVSMDTLILDELLTEETDEEEDWTEVLSVH